MARLFMFTVGHRKRSNNLLVIIFLVGIGIHNDDGHAASIGTSPPETWHRHPNHSMYIRGKIERGDYEKILKGVRHFGHIPSIINITSPGGDVETAMKIGRFMRRTAMSVRVKENAECNSSCVIILAGAVKRIIKAPIGIHRPYYDRSVFANLSPTEAESWYQDMDKSVREYFAEMNISESFVERMMSIPSSKIEFVSVSEFYDTFHKMAPAHQEWLNAKCGSLTDSENRDFKALIYHLEYSILQEMEQEVLDPAIKKLIRLEMEEFEPLWRYASGLSEGYDDYLTEKSSEHSQCANDALDEHRHNVLMELQK